MLEAIVELDWGFRVNKTDLVGVHIGLTKKGDNWLWDNSGKKLSNSTSKWNIHEPSGEGRCAGIWTLPDGCWNDYSCTRIYQNENVAESYKKPFGAICER